jgi:hypothetical protein
MQIGLKPSSNLPPLNKPVPFPVLRPVAPVVTSEYSDPDIGSDDDSDLFSNLPMFYPEYQPLIFLNAERSEAHFKAVPGHVRPLKNTHRSKVVAWLIRISDKMQFQDETLLLGVALFDRISALKRIIPREFQLHASTSLWIASKIEEKVTPTLSDFTYLCGSIYTPADFLECETQILALLHFAVASTTPIIYVQGAVESGSEVAELARFFCLVLLFRPSYAAMSASAMGTTAVLLARLVRGERAKVARQSVEAVLACTQQVVLAMQEVGGYAENPVRHALPRWLGGKGVGELKEQIAALLKTDAIRRFCCPR